MNLLVQHGVRFRLLALVLVLVCPSRAAAHHLLEESGFGWLAPRSFVGMEFQTAGFDLEAGSGRWEVASPSAEYAITQRVSVSGRVPFARIAYDDGRRVSGLSDMNLGVRGVVLANGHGSMLLSAGVEFELPTGDKDNGLGHGAYEASPFVATAMTPRPDFIFEAAIANHFSTSDYEEHVEPASASRSHSEPAPPPQYHGGHDEGGELHGSVIAPHHDRELFTRVAATYIHGRAYVSGGVDVAVILGESADDPWVARTGVGILLGQRWRLAGGVEAPFAGERRSELASRVSLTRLFNR